MLLRLNIDYDSAEWFGNLVKTEYEKSKLDAILSSPGALFDELRGEGVYKEDTHGSEGDFRAMISSDVFFDKSNVKKKVKLKFKKSSQT